MEKNTTFKEIEKMYRSYGNLKYKLEMLQPKYVQVLSFAPSGGGNAESKTEKMAIERAELENRVKLIQLCLGAMTHDERLFIEYRYNQELTLELTAESMNWSRAQICRIRQSVLAKTKWLLITRGTKIELNAC